MTKIKVSVDRSLCMGTGVCVMAAPDVFDQDDECKVVISDEYDGESDIAKVREAMESCPTRAISVEDLA